MRKGISTVEDKRGNDRSDENADKGVEQLAGEGLVALGSWVTGRQIQYDRFMARIHKMIVAVTKAEKEERKKAKIIDNQLLGYDPEKWVETNLNLDNRGPTGMGGPIPRVGSLLTVGDGVPDRMNQRPPLENTAGST